MVRTQGKKEIMQGVKLIPSTAPTAEQGLVYFDNGLNKARISNDGSTFKKLFSEEDTGTTANKLVQLDGAAKLPVVDGSQLTNVTSLMTKVINSPSEATVIQPTVTIGGAGTNLKNISLSTPLLDGERLEIMFTIKGNNATGYRFYLGTDTTGQADSLFDSAAIAVGTATFHLVYFRNSAVGYQSRGYAILSVNSDAPIFKLVRDIDISTALFIGGSNVGSNNDNISISQVIGYKYST